MLRVPILAVSLYLLVPLELPFSLLGTVSFCPRSYEVLGLLLSAVCPSEPLLGGGEILLMGGITLRIASFVILGGPTVNSWPLAWFGNCRSVT